MLFATGNHDCLDGVVCGCGQWFAECLVLYLSKSSNVFVHFAKKYVSQLLNVTMIVLWKWSVVCWVVRVLSQWPEDITDRPQSYQPTTHDCPKELTKKIVDITGYNNHQNSWHRNRGIKNWQPEDIIEGPQSTTHGCPSAANHQKSWQKK